MPKQILYSPSLAQSHKCRHPAIRSRIISLSTLSTFSYSPFPLVNHDLPIGQRIVRSTCDSLLSCSFSPLLRSRFPFLRSIACLRTLSPLQHPLLTSVHGAVRPNGGKKEEGLLPPYILSRFQYLDPSYLPPTHLSFSPPGRTRMRHAHAHLSRVCYIPCREFSQVKGCV